MIVDSVHIPINTADFDLRQCQKDTWLVLLHARRVPPHVGLSINGSYNSLTIKGHELNIPLEAVYKMATQKGVEAVFIKVARHPVFSADYQLAVLQEMILAYPGVKQHEASCLSPIRDFFQEFYAVGLKQHELLFDFVERLNQNNYLETASACNLTLKQHALEIPFYTPEELNEKIKKERQPFYND